MKISLAFAALCLLAAVQASVLPETTEDRTKRPNGLEAEAAALEAEAAALGGDLGSEWCGYTGCCNCSRGTDGKCHAVGVKVCLTGNCVCTEKLGVCLGNCS